MALTKQEQLEQNLVDGVNREFETSVPYVAGSVRCFNPLWTSTDFVEELGGTSIRLAEAPKLGDVWLLHYNHD